MYATELTDGDIGKIFAFEPQVLAVPSIIGQKASHLSQRPFKDGKLVICGDQYITFEHQAGGINYRFTIHARSCESKLKQFGFESGSKAA